MTGMTDPTPFLRAQFNLAEKVAKEAGAVGTPSWSAVPSVLDRYIVRDSDDNAVVYDEGSPTPEQALHIALHDPVSVVSDIEAKRQIIALHRAHPWRQEYGTPLCAKCSDLFPCDTLLLLTIPFIHQPGYRNEWSI